MSVEPTCIFPRPIEGAENILVVGVSDMRVSSCADATLRTYSLGSCLGLSLYDPISRVGGMLHCMLPLSRMNQEAAVSNPYAYVDTAVPLLLQALFDAGATRSGILTKVAGCAERLNDSRLFRIGKKNYSMLRKILWKNSILIDGEDVGGTIARTMSLDLATGVTTIQSQGETWRI